MNELTTTTTTALTGKKFDKIKFLSEWAEYIADRSEVTQKSYAVTINCFLEWLYNECITTPQRKDIIAYREWLLSPHKSKKDGEMITFTVDTAARYFRGCKMFFSFLEYSDNYKDITKNVRSPKTNPNEFKRDSLEGEECVKVLESIDRSTEEGKRDYCMIFLSIDCGLRIIELQRANIGDIVTHAGKHRLYIQGKGHSGKDDYKKLEPELMEALEDYLKTRKDKSKNAPLFVATETNAKNGGGRMTEPAISRRLKKVLVNAGFDSPRITPHSLRHTSVTLDRIAGATIEEASKHARHTSIAVTQRYDHALEKAAAKDERRIIDYIFNKTSKKSQEERLLEIFSRIDSDSKREKALELLEAIV